MNGKWPLADTGQSKPVFPDETPRFPFTAGKSQQEPPAPLLLGGWKDTYKGLVFRVNPDPPTNQSEDKLLANLTMASLNW